MDREKVIKGFECCMTDMNRSDSMPCRSCPYGTLPKKENCQKQMFADVYAMLKEQDAKTGTWIEKTDYMGDTYYDCSVCDESWTTIDGTPWQNGMNYCPHCGAKMKT